MTMAWTADQRSAIEASEGNLVVAAAAGSGKTAVLVERICRLIVAEGADVERMLISTFTRAAAAEMRERIARRVQEEAAAGGPESRRLQRQLNRMDRAPIGTLHSFCDTLLRQYYHLIGLEPTFRVEDENVTESLLDEVLTDVIEECFEAGDAVFLNLADCWGGRDGEGLADLVSTLYHRIQNYPDPLGWLRTQAAAFDFARLEDTPWYGELVRRVEDNLRLAGSLLDTALQECALPGGPAVYLPQLEAEQAALTALLAQYDGALPPLESLTGVFGRLPAARGAVGGERKAAVQSLRNAAKKAVETAQKNPLLAGRAALETRTHAVAPQMAALCRVVEAFDEAFAREKRRQNVLDFNDLEHLALRVLADDAVHQEVLETYDYVFVDEYQDISPIQDAILRQVARPGRFFCVGDVKQGIYRFRAAEPAIFLSRLERCGTPDAPGERRIDLAMNFRSAPRVVALVNYLFDGLMSRRLGDVDYTGPHRLVAGAAAPPSAGDAPPEEGNELILIDNGGRTDRELTRLQELISLEREATVIAARIERQLAQPLWDGKAGLFRPTRLSDIVILLRSVSGVAGVYTDVLRRCGIPAEAEGEGGFGEQLEIQLLMSCLRLIDNTQRDEDLIACLASVVGGLELADLVELRGVYRDGSFAQAVLSYAAGQQDTLAERLRAFLRRLEGWRALARHSDLEKLIWQVFEESTLMDWAATLPSGDGRQANLRQAALLGRGFPGTLADFLLRFARLSSKLKRATGGAQMEAVRILTVHKSKGLEFPVVILANLSKQINQMDTIQPFLLHGSLGLGPRFHDAAQRTYGNTLARLAIQGRIHRENCSEEMRLLYVALTRARERLILVATVGDLSAALTKWRLPVSAELLASGNQSWLDWLGPMALRSPAGEALLAGDDGAAQPPHDPLWRIDTVAAEGIERRFVPVGDRLARVDALMAALPDEVPADIERDLTWRYPWGDVAALPSKVSATSLLDRKRNWRGPVPAPEIKRRPLFLEQTRRYSATELGTFAHTVLQLLPVNVTLAEVPAYLADYESRGLLPEGVAGLINLGWIERYLMSDLVRRMQASPRVEREVPFNLSLPARVVFPKDTGEDEPVLVQGIIDCCFLERDRWVLVDYKTNRVDATQTAESLVEHYRPQLVVYRQALETITGTPVESGWLYLLSVGEARQVL